MLTKAGLAVLDVLCVEQEATVQELSAETGYSREHVYRVVDDLLEAGLLDEFRQHRNQRVLSVTDTPVVEAYRHLTVKLGHVEWPDLLSPATIRVCWHLDQPRRITTVADRLGVTRQAVHNALAPLKNRAMLAPAGPDYKLTDDLQPLLDFVRAVVMHDHRTRVRRLAPTATVDWCDPKRALVQVQKQEETDRLQNAADWNVTGLAKFQAYGLQFLLAGEPAFWYAPDDTLTPADVVCHTLVLNADSRRVSYAMLLIEKEDIEQEILTETAAWYGIKPEITQLYHVLNEEFDTADNATISLPSAQEYAALKHQYGVA